MLRERRKQTVLRFGSPIQFLTEDSDDDCHDCTDKGSDEATPFDTGNQSREYGMEH